MNNKQFGYLGEKIAKFYLQINDYQILKCNFTCKFGEIDIIAKKGNYIHFVEVKTRRNEKIDPRESINLIKQQHIWKVAEFFLYINNIQKMGIQFDAIEVWIERNELKIKYIPEIINH